MQTQERTSDTVTEAKAEFIRAKDRILRALEATPDDRINWSPSGSCRTPLALVAHAAMAIEGMQKWMDGKQTMSGDTAEWDSSMIEAEKEYTSREKAVDLMEKNSSAYVEWMDSLTPEQLEKNFETPFGSFPMTAAITFPADHTRGHAAQLEYLQTIYGDRVWR